jgi:hypothetical protein
MGSAPKALLYPRAPRFNLRTPITLRLPDGMVKGRSLNVSESGMLAVFDVPLDIWITGRLFVVIADLHIGLNARVARAEGRETGLTFQIADEADRIAIRSMIEYAIQTGAPPYGDMPPTPQT